MGHLLPLLIVQSIAELHNPALPWIQPADGVVQQILFNLILNIMVNHILIRSQDIREKQLISIPIHIQRLVNGDLQPCLAVAPQIHEDLILDASGGVGRQLNIFVRLKGIDRLNQANCPYGD